MYLSHKGRFLKNIKQCKTILTILLSSEVLNNRRLLIIMSMYIVHPENLGFQKRGQSIFVYYYQQPPQIWKLNKNSILSLKYSYKDRIGIDFYSAVQSC